MSGDTNTLPSWAVTEKNSVVGVLWESLLCGLALIGLVALIIIGLTITKPSKPQVVLPPIQMYQRMEAHGLNEKQQPVHAPAKLKKKAAKR